MGTSLFISLVFYRHPLKKFFFSEKVTFFYFTTLIGFLLFTSSKDLVSLFISLEISTLGISILLSFLDPNRKSLEGSFKFFIMGLISSTFILLGVAFLYASTGSLILNEIFFNISEIKNFNWFFAGTGFIFCGLFSKLALAPFHSWMPDSYESGPTGITALLATSYKNVILVFLLRLIPLLNILNLEFVIKILSVFITVSFTLGSLMPLAQISIKRLFAYTSINHNAFFALGLLCIRHNSEIIPVLLCYVFGYTLITLITLVV